MLEKSLLREDDKKIRIKSHDDDTFNGENLRRRVSRGKKKQGRRSREKRKNRASHRRNDEHLPQKNHKMKMLISENKRQAKSNCSFFTFGKFYAFL